MAACHERRVRIGDVRIERRRKNQTDFVRPRQRHLQLRRDRAFDAIQMFKQRENRHIRLRTPDAGFVMAMTWPLAEDQQGHGQKKQNDWLPAGDSHIPYYNSSISCFGDKDFAVLFSAA